MIHKMMLVIRPVSPTRLLATVCAGLLVAGSGRGRAAEGAKEGRVRICASRVPP